MFVVWLKSEFCLWQKNRKNAWSTWKYGAYLNSQSQLNYIRTGIWAVEMKLYIPFAVTHRVKGCLSLWDQAISLPCWRVLTLLDLESNIFVVESWRLWGASCLSLQAQDVWQSYIYGKAWVDPTVNVEFTFIRCGIDEYLDELIIARRTSISNTCTGFDAGRQPCKWVSIIRSGLDDPRSSLALCITFSVFTAIVED